MLAGGEVDRAAFTDSYPVLGDHLVTGSLMNRNAVVKISTLSFLFLLTLAGMAAATSYTMITKEDLLAQRDAQDLIIVDVRPMTSWMFSTSKIKGAVRENPNDVESWLGKYPKDRTIVLYCQTDVTSLGVGRKLASAGFQNVRVLKGGWSDWARAKYPTEAK